MNWCLLISLTFASPMPADAPENVPGNGITAYPHNHTAKTGTNAGNHR